MSYLNDVFYCEAGGNLYKMTNDEIVAGFTKKVGQNPTAILVCTDRTTLVVANSGSTVSQSSSIYIYNTVSDTLIKSINTQKEWGCKTPVGLCEDSAGNIYASFINGSAGTVVKFNKTGTKLQSYRVGNYPQGIACDSLNNLYVCCQGVNRVDVWNTTSNILVKTISLTGAKPSSVCCDKQYAWVVGTGKPLVYYIDPKNNYKTDVVQLTNTTATLYDICVDREGNKWVSSPNLDKVYKIVNKRASTGIIVGDEPRTICSNDTGDIYVYNTGRNPSITKLTNNLIVANIPTQNGYIPDGSFGDPTGYKNYYHFKYIVPTGGSSGGTLEDGSVTYAKLAPELKAVVDKIISGGGSGTITSLSDDKVTHAHSEYNTVKKALDYLLYEDPAIVSLSCDVNSTQEAGDSISNITFTWNINKDMTVEFGKMSGSTFNKLTVITDGTNTYKDTASYNANQTWRVKATDGVKTVTKDISIKFVNKAYVGVFNGTSITESQVKSVLTGNLTTSAKGTYTLNCSGGQYIYVAVPTSFGVTTGSFSIGGLANSDWVVTNGTFTHNTARTAYTIFRSNNIQTGSNIKLTIA